MKVFIIQRILPHYRVSFFDSLCKSLRQEGIDLKIIYGQEYPGTVPKTVNVDADWAIRIENKYIKIHGKEVIWQPALKYIKDADIVIIEQANRFLLNYYLQYVWRNKKQKLAYWGHGKNMQDRGVSFSEYIKKRMIKSVDWWFAYTSISVNAIESLGVNREIITCVNNTIDTVELKNDLESVGDDDKDRVKSELNIKTENVCMYCGGMYPDKRLDFLVKSLEMAKSKLNDLEVIFIGSGPDENIIVNACKQNKWMHYVGAKFGKEKASYLSVSKIMVMPGLVGLAIIDSFVAKVPIFTTDIPIHSPEIAYLNNGINGVITGSSIEEYSDELVHYMSSPERINVLQTGCMSSALEYGLSSMVRNYSNGVKKLIGQVS